MDYEHLTGDQQRQIVTGRLRQLEGEHYGNTLALATAKALKADAEVAKVEANLHVIETAIETARAELKKLPEGEPADTPARRRKATT